MFPVLESVASGGKGTEVTPVMGMGLEGACGVAGGRRCER